MMEAPGQPRRDSTEGAASRIVPKVKIPVAVVMSRRMVSRSGWTTASWRAVGIVAGQGLADREAGAFPVHGAGDDEEQFLWRGLQLELHRDASESYWSNLMAREPRLVVLCAERDDGLLEPLAVSADMHEASAGIEGDRQVFATAIPPEVYLLIERFVVEYHTPARQHRRKRSRAERDAQR